MEPKVIEVQMSPSSWILVDQTNKNALVLMLAQVHADAAHLLAAVANGAGAYVSWFDGIGNGFDVRLQRLGENGTELLAPGGILVADRGFSSTQDYGLAVAASGAALLAFRDDRFVGTQVTAARIAADGAGDGLEVLVAGPVAAAFPGADRGLADVASSSQRGLG